MLILFFFLFSHSSSNYPLNSAWANPSPQPIRFLLSNWSFATQFEKEMSEIVKKYNESHTDYPVQLLWRGEDFSSTKELIAQHLAGSAPEISAIEYTEFPAIQSAKITQSISDFKPLGLKKIDTLPFKKTVPILFVNQERLFRIHMDHAKIPSQWDEFVTLVKKLTVEAQSSPDRYALALPLQGTRGLWMLEALIPKPLWKREVGGLKTNLALEPQIEELQKLLDHPKTARVEETWEKAVQAFIDRKASILMGSLDLIPFITQEARFRWTSGPLPQMLEGISRLEGGSHLVITQNTPGVLNFLNYLYSSPVAKKWLQSGGFLPLGASTIKNYTGKLRPRSTDTDIIRTRSNWIQALHLLFGDASRRMPAKSVLTQLDSQLTLR